MIAADLPQETGAYALYYLLAAPLALTITRLNDPVLQPGCYVYAGNARGSGGIRARVARHLRREKTLHWHIDYLSTEASCVRVDAFLGGNECSVIRELLQNGASTPVPGFGSSDCRICPAHLVCLAGT